MQNYQHYPPVQPQYPLSQSVQGTSYPQPSYASPPYMQAVNVTVTTPKGPGLVLRAVYYLCIGWWLGFLWLNLGIVFCLLLITLPLGLAILNRLPQILTLRPASMQTGVSVATMAAPGPYGMPMHTVNVRVGGQVQQRNFLVRAGYFICIGWWAGWIWAYVGYALCMFIVTLPIGLMMLNRLPAVLTLRKH